MNSRKKNIINKKLSQPRVRFAPSPTGQLHLGTARTALFNYLFAKKHQGNFILRIEDTDVERSKPEYEKDILDSLTWLGLKWDEGPFRQSERQEIYQKYIQKLLDSEQAFWCSHTPGKLKRIIRFHCPKKKIVFDDLIRGKIEFDTSLLGDFSIAKDLKTPLYNLAVVIDDAEMKISHIIRGEDHISNTPKQILLYEALGLKIPQYAHLSLILGPDKSKLSKRHETMAILEYKKQGYLAQALINFMAFLGWNPGDEREMFTLKDLEKEFSLARVGESSAIFNLQRLDYLNGYYIRQMNINELVKLCIPYLDEKAAQHKDLKKIIALEQERLKKLNEIGKGTKFFFTDVLKYKKELLRWKDMTDKEISASLDKTIEILSQIKEGNWNKKFLEKILIMEAEKFRVGLPAEASAKAGDRGYLLWPLRVALTNKKASAPPFEIAEILGKQKTLDRIKRAKGVV